MPYRATDMMNWAWFLLIPVNQLVNVFVPQYALSEATLVPIVGILVLLGYLRFIAGAVRAMAGIKVLFNKKASS